MCLSAAVALALAGVYHLGVAATVAGLMGGLPGLYLAWAAVRGVEEPVREPARLADDLAELVGRQWEDEAALRRLNDPYPLPVSWKAADGVLGGDWDSLVTLARTGAGWPPAHPDQWAAGPGELAGSGDEIAAVLVKVPTRRMVILGEPGSGKTMLLVRLVLDLLADRDQGGPVPVLVSLASWDPDAQGLHEWLTERLAIDYPSLASAGSRAGQDSALARLVDARLITPVLDGLDEMPDGKRDRAMEAISEAPRPGEAIVVTCRTADYRAAVMPPAGSGISIRGAAVVALRPLDQDTVAAYLVRDGGAGAAERWQPVIAALGAGTPVGEVLTTPLMVGLARTIYSPRAGERAGQLPRPAELCQIHDQDAVKDHLFDAFVEGSYRHRPGAPWTADQAKLWLGFLARHLENTVNSPDLAWWQLREAARPGLLRFGLGLAAILISALGGMLAVGIGVTIAQWRAYGAAVLVAGPLVGLVLGLADGVVAGAVIWIPARADRATAKPSRLLPFKVRNLAVGIAVAAVAVPVAIRVDGLSPVPVAALFLVVVAIGLGLAIIAGLGDVTAQSDQARALDPAAVLRRDRQAALGISAGITIACGLAGAGVGGMDSFSPNWQAPGLARWETVITVAMFGLVVGLAAGLRTSKSKTAWPDYILTLCWLARRHLPRQLMAFLSDAHQRGVLRQVGSVYQFRHIDLQRRLASLPTQTSQDAPGDPARTPVPAAKTPGVPS